MEATEAQVFKCTEAVTGTITYTDGACAGAASRANVSTLTPSEGGQPVNSSPHKAGAMDQERHNKEMMGLRDHGDAGYYISGPGSRGPSAVVLGGPSGQSSSFECARAKRDLEVAQSSITRNAGVIDARKQAMELACVGAAGFVEIEKSRPATPVEPTFQQRYVCAGTVANLPNGEPIASCNSQGCFGTSGHFYKSATRRKC